jgi:lipoprotein NlpD
MRKKDIRIESARAGAQTAATGVVLFTECKDRAMTAGSRLIAAALLGLVLASCATQRAPVVTVDRSPPVQSSQCVHVVVRGDTLYAIAWRYETTVDKLAQLNGLTPPYLIHVGNRLVLDPPVTAEPAAGKATSASGVVAMAVPQAQLHTQPDSRPVVAGAPVPPPGAAPVPQAGSAGPRSSAASNGIWQWPATGNVTRQYDSNGQFKGINIQSRPGTPIQAAASGEVVYAGDGLRGYGQLVIVKHSEVYLSAYAYNRVMAVREGDKVTAGQRLGEVGGDAANPGRLYFEIRKQGDPIDPTRLLPSQ